VEDSDQVREVVRTQLERAGYNVLVARDADGAIGAAAQHRSGIDLLLSDIMLPGMSGPDLEVALRKTYPRLRVLFMSGYTERLVLKRSALAQQRIALHKPFSMNELMHAVRDYLDKKPTSE
jgi:CheY-like chemotaxis protein